MRLFSEVFLVVTSLWTMSSAEMPDNWHGGQQKTPCSKILIVAPISSASHIFVYASFAEGLAAKCHSVDMIVSYEAKTVKHPNVRQFSTETFQRLSTEYFTFKMDELPDYSWMIGTWIAGWLNSQSPKCCNDLLDDPVFREFLDKPNDYYDMVLISPHMIDDCALAFAHKARVGGKPWGNLFSTITMPWISIAFGNPGLATYRPLYTSTWTLPMTFIQQVASQLSNMALALYRIQWVYPQVRQILAEKWNSTIPDLAELERTSAISFDNDDPRLFSYQEPRVADMIGIAGVHVKPSKALPKELDNWANSAKKGFVLFALGSAVKSKHFPEPARKAFVEAFKQFPEVQFLWKWDFPTMEDTPSNVRLEKWLPQSDVLGHKKIRGFITHGGMLSTQEATYNGVPVIGLPIGADQHVNMARVAKVDNSGEVLEWADLSTEKIVAALKRILEDEFVIASVKRRERLFKDQPQTPMERGIFWTEYVIRNGYDTGLRSPTRDMYWFDMYAVLLWLFVLAIIGIVLGSIIFFIRLILRACITGNGKAKDKKQQKNSGRKLGGKKQGNLKVD